MDPADWFSFEMVLARMDDRRPPDGIGFVFAPENGLVGVDLDSCRDPETSVVKDWALDIVRRLATYAEVSPAGTGVKLVARGCLLTAGGRRDNIELYAHSRFFTLTGNRLPDVATTIVDCQDELDVLYRKVRGGAAVPVLAKSRATVEGMAGRSDAEVPVLIAQGSMGVRFVELWAGDTSRYQSTSEADLALCGAIGRLVGPDPVRVEAVFNLSALATRPK